MKLRPLVTLAATVGALLLLAAPASASTQIKIREVAPGNNPYLANPEFVELQALADGQSDVDGRKIRFYGPTGTELSSFTIPSNVANGGNQRTILLGSDDAESGFGVRPDFTYGSARLDVGGGAICYAALDCVSWGSFSGTLPSPAGTPADAVTGTQSLTRTIARGCETVLDGPDDTNAGADFALTATPTPRHNATPPTETLCGGSTDTTPPDTAITLAPKKVVKTKKKKAKVKFKFTATESRSTFECSIDGRGFGVCESPLKLKLKKGKHTFSVRAIDEAGNTDQTPASSNFKVKKKKRHHGAKHRRIRQGSA